jgi:hypothetical protein
MSRFDYLLKKTELVDIIEYYGLKDIIEKYVNNKLNNLNVLEIGSGNGKNSILFSEYVKSYIGIESNKEYVNISVELCKKIIVISILSTNRCWNTIMIWNLNSI